MISPLDPEVQEVPEAIDAVNKYYMMKEFGWAETWRSFDLMPYSDYEMLAACINANTKKEKMEADRAQFYSREAALLPY